MHGKSARQQHTFGRIHHRRHIARCVDECKALLGARDNGDRSFDFVQAVLRVVLHQTANQSGFANAGRTNNRDNNRGWIIRKIRAVGQRNVQLALHFLQLVARLSRRTRGGLSAKSLGVALSLLFGGLILLTFALPFGILLRLFFIGRRASRGLAVLLPRLFCKLFHSTLRR